MMHAFRGAHLPGGPLPINPSLAAAINWMNTRGLAFPVLFLFPWTANP